MNSFLNSNTVLIDFRKNLPSIILFEAAIDLASLSFCVMGKFFLHFLLQKI